MWFIIKVCCCVMILAHCCAIHFEDKVSATLKLQKYIDKLDATAVPLLNRTISVYFMAERVPADSQDVMYNNLQLFVSAMVSHSDSSHFKSFYLFSVEQGITNTMIKYLPKVAAENIAFISSTHSHDVFSHVDTILKILDSKRLDKMSTILFTSNSARGPFFDRNNGNWWKHFVDPLYGPNSIGMIGSMISCDGPPHVLWFSVAMRSNIAVSIGKAMKSTKMRIAGGGSVEMEKVATETVILTLGLRISSLYHQKRYNQTVFPTENKQSTCPTSLSNYHYTAHSPISWCDNNPNQLLFMKWGGLLFKQRGFACSETINRIHAATLRIASTEPQLHLVLPETIYGHPWYAVSKQFDLETWKGDHARALPFHALPSPDASADTEKVCLVVRCSYSQGDEFTNTTKTVIMNLRVFISTLLRQDNPNWEAYFIVTDDQPFDAELITIINGYNDVRLQYLPLESKFRQKYNPIDAAYLASDEAMRIIMKNPKCSWISVTNGDNAYGSAVVSTVLHNAQIKRTNLIVFPMDSRNFANEEYKRLRKLKRLTKERTWRDYCNYFEDKVVKVPSGFARAGRLNIGGVDVAELFIDRKKFLETNVPFNAYARNDPTCHGCQDGIWTTKMIQQKGWTANVLPLRDLSTMIFHGPSPLWCIAGGHVWLDHPTDTACLSHRTVGKLLLSSSMYDSNRFFRTGGPRVCLRLSEKGFTALSSRAGANSKELIMV